MHISYEVADRVATVTLDRPEKKNALNEVMIAELHEAFERAEGDPSVKVILLQANGDTFCAGADLMSLQRLARSSMEVNLEDSRRLVRLYAQIFGSSKPTVSVVRGPALAGGCGLATVCDFVIGSREKASFGYPEVRIGFLPAIVMVFLARRIGEGRARELVVRGSILDADTAARVGLISESAENVDTSLRALLDDLLKGNSRVAMAKSKELLRDLARLRLDEALDLAVRINAESRFSEDCRRGLEAFARKERIRW